MILMKFEWPSSITDLPELGLHVLCPLADFESVPSVFAGLW